MIESYLQESEELMRLKHHDCDSQVVDSKKTFSVLDQGGGGSNPLSPTIISHIE
jgi:hypothetical protein